MADVVGRSEQERRLARAVAREFNSFRMDVFGLIPEEPGMFVIPAAVWAEHTTGLTQAISPVIQDTYINQATALLDDIAYDIDWTLVNDAAIDFARDYTYNLVNGINNTSRTTLQKAIQSYFNESMTRADLERLLRRSFGESRVSRIAVTEITKAASEGERGVRRELDKDGVDSRVIWITNNDEIVHKCPVCWPRHNEEIEPNPSPETGGEWPPAHPNCRCWPATELVRRK